MEDIRIAVVVCNAKVGETQQNLDKAAYFVGEARNEKADLICFPEMSLTGYSNHPDIIEIAEPVPGICSEALREMADSNRMCILAGLAEKSDDGRIYAGHLIAMPQEDIRLYRKLHIAPPEKEIYSAGKTAPLFQFKQTTFGIQLCYDAHFPELSTSMAMDGAEILFMPHASPRGLAFQKHKSWMRHLTARAFDNSLFIVACNQTGNNGKGLTFPGNSVIIGPTGDVIHRSLSSREEIMIADLKAADLRHVRSNRMHFFLPHRRPELYK
jgi:N-carbamoylputrescine amidase